MDLRPNFVRSLTSVLLGCTAALAAGPAAADDRPAVLPDLFVTASRLGDGITGASTTVVTADDIARSPARTLPEILSAQPGVQVRSLYGAVGGAGATIDMRGFGAAGTSNTLVLVNGRRLNDVDMAGVDLSTIPLDSVERIEVTRGNSGAVLYGDGAMGGVINIVTKTGAGRPASARIEAGFGSFNQREGAVSGSASNGPVSATVSANAVDSDGYRVNNALRQRNAAAEFRHSGTDGSAYVNLSADDQHLGFPGARRVTLTSSELVTDRRGATTPFDYGDKQGLNATAGITRQLGDVELVLDGGIRRKMQQAGFFSAWGAVFDSYVDTTLTTYSLTPRANVRHTLFGLPSKATAGVDVYKSVYGSDRANHKGEAAYHHYDIDQLTVAGYWQETVAVRPDTDVSFGGRLQRNAITARDRFDPSAPGGAFASPPVQGEPLDKSEWQYAAHAGFEHRFDSALAVFGRVGRSFRLPNVDERVGMAPWGTPTSFDLKTQTSHDIEGGYRLSLAGLDLQQSVYLMDLTNELHYSPVTFTNVNLDPTRRWGVETTGSYRLTEAVRLKGGVAYTRAVFREGANAGHDVPLVARWSGHAGASWDVWRKWLVLDLVARFYGPARMDNDQANFQPLIPAHTLVDVRLGGEIDQPFGRGPVSTAFWSVAVQNLFDADYFEYAVASATTFGTYNAYPMPGRAYMVRAGVKF